MWTGSDGLLSRRDLRVFVPEGLESLCPGGDSRLFVPEGLNDRSQAIYCLECVQKATRPIGTV
jgi:hypothetical protein